MAELHAPEGLLRGLRVGRHLGGRNGVNCFELIHDATGQRFVLKHVSLPASEEKLEALILSGAYSDKTEADSYYRRLADDMVEEIRQNQALRDCPNILCFLRYQLVPKTSGVGCDLYVVTDRLQTLADYRQEHALTHLQAINLGIDLSAALCAIRKAGFVFEDLRPENVYMTESGRFLLGDFGLASTKDMQYSSLPEQYVSEFTAPELGDPLSGLNETIDTYSLGMLLYRIYNGFHAPFEDESTGAAAAEERRRSGEALPAPLYADYELAAILSKACAYRPEDRYAKPEELEQVLTDYMRRNEVSDRLIVPPITAPDEPLDEALAAQEPEPVSFTDVNELDEEFKAHFRPDTASLAAVIDAVRKEEARSEAAEDAPDVPPVEEDGAPDVPPEEIPEPASTSPSCHSERSEESQEAAETKQDSSVAALPQNDTDVVPESPAAPAINPEPAPTPEPASVPEPAPAPDPASVPEPAVTPEPAPTPEPIAGDGAPDVPPETNPEPAPASCHSERSEKSQKSAEARQDSSVAALPQNDTAPAFEYPAASEAPDIEALLSAADVILAHSAPGGNLSAVKIEAPQEAPAPTEALPDEPTGPLPDEAAAQSAEYADAPEAAPVRVRQTRRERLRERKLAAKQSDRKKKKHLGVWIALGVVVALIAAVLLLYRFTDFGHNIYEYEITVSEFRVTEVGVDSVTLEVVSNAKDGMLQLQCSDRYGNSLNKSVGSEPIRFEGLGSGEQYSFKLTLEGFHKLSGVTECSANTLPTTELLSFQAALGPEDGSVELQLLTKEGDAVPEDWRLEIRADGEDVRETHFSGTETTVTGLTVGKEYTFTLCNTAQSWLTGKTETTFTLIPLVHADGLRVSDLLDGTVTLQWRCSSELPDEWTVFCEDPAGEVAEQTLREAKDPKDGYTAVKGEDGDWLCETALGGVTPGKEYLYRIEAEGLYHSLNATLPAEVLYVDSFRAEVAADSITLTWEGNTLPADGLLLQILPDGNEEFAFTPDALDGNSYTLRFRGDANEPTLLPDTAYEFRLLSADGSTLYGHTSASARSEAAEIFDRLSISIQSDVTGLYPLPAEDEWDETDVRRQDRRTSFGADESIVLLLRNRTQAQRSDNTVNILYVIRDGEGRLVDFFRDRQAWNEMWATRHWASELLRTPQTPGSYRLEVYFSFQRPQSFPETGLPFTITE